MVGVVSRWDRPSTVVRARLTTEERLGDRWLREARSALGAACGLGIQLIEVKVAPDLLLLGGREDWAASFMSTFRQAGNLTPVVVLNASARCSTARVLDAGADDCLGRPFDAGELRARVTALMRRSTPGLASYSEISADRTTHRIRVCDVEARVSRKQFEIFVCLAEHRGRWVHSDEIIARVSGTP